MCPNGIRQMLLNERYLGLDRKLYVMQICVLTAIWCNAGQYPRATFLIHQAPRAVDRVDDDTPYGIGRNGSTWQDDLAAVQAFGDQGDRNLRSDLPLKKIEQEFFAHSVHGKYRVALAIIDDR